jgi:hypothetical protein
VPYSMKPHKVMARLHADAVRGRHNYHTHQWVVFKGKKVNEMYCKKCRCAWDNVLSCNETIMFEALE